MGGYSSGMGGGFGMSNYGVTQQITPTVNPSCPRQYPQAGYGDWIGLADPQFAFFNVCPTCYNAVACPTPYAN